MVFYPAISPYIKGIIIAGSILPTLNFLPKERLTPTQNMSIEPMNEMFAIMLSFIMGAIKPAHIVTVPWRIATGMAENATHTITITRSRAAFAKSVS